MLWQLCFQDCMSHGPPNKVISMRQYGRIQRFTRHCQVSSLCLFHKCTHILRYVGESRYYSLNSIARCTANKEIEYQVQQALSRWRMCWIGGSVFLIPAMICPNGRDCQNTKPQKDSSYISGNFYIVQGRLYVKLHIFMASWVWLRI